MKNPSFVVLFAVLSLLAGACSEGRFIKKDERLFELRTYYPALGKLEALQERFRNHTLALFEKHGMQHIGYWVTNDDDPKLVYLVAFADKAEKEAAWKNFLDDPEWKSAYAESIKDGRLVKEIDSVLLETTDYSPTIVQESSNPSRLFELRTYKASSGNLANLDARFRNTTMGLFAKHGATNLVYFHVAEGEEGAEDSLIYLLAHDSEEAREATFAAFRKDPDWISARAKTEEAAGGSLTQGRSKVQFLRPTDYSKIK